MSQQLSAFPWAEDGTSMHVVRDVLDTVVYDAHPFQILGPRHLERLGGVPDGAVELPGGRVALSCGELADGLPGSPTRAGAKEAAHRVLAPLLVRGLELAEVRRQRWAPGG